jgi:transcriptional regulator with XRE-family HTH domain
MPAVHPLKVAIAADGRHGYEIAVAARINPSALSGIISGRIVPTVAVKARLAEVLGVPVAELFGDVDQVAS